MKLFFRKMILTTALLLAMLAPGVGSSQTFTTGPAQSTPLVSPIQIGEARKVHLILTGLVADSDIGPNCRKDIIAMKQLFVRSFHHLGAGRLEVHPLVGEEWTADMVRDYLRNMQIDANDVVIFYQSGHGKITNAQMPAASHQIQLSSQESISRNEVVQLLKLKPSRGVIVMTDCCSSIIPGRHNRSAQVDQASAERVSLNPETIRNLFLRFHGYVDITAADIGIAASVLNHLNDFGGASSAFTVAFLKLACDNQAFQNWQSFYPALQGMTRMASSNQHQAFAYQIAEGNSPAQPTVSAPVVPTTPAMQPVVGLSQPSMSMARPDRIRD